MGSEIDVRFPGVGGDAEKTILWSGQDKIFAMGATVPAGSSSGYAKGCLFIQTDGGTNTTLYVNEGSNTSSTFVAAINN